VHQQRADAAKFVFCFSGRAEHGDGGPGNDLPGVGRLGRACRGPGAPPGISRRPTGRPRRAASPRGGRSRAHPLIPETTQWTSTTCSR
jgi:hypothetical protein